MTFRDTVKRLRREKMLQATREDLARLGCDALQMKDVAAVASLSRTTLYGEYGSRNALIDAALSAAVDDLMPRLEAELSSEPTRTKILAAVELLAQGALERRGSYIRLPCCLRRVECPWRHWDRVELTISQALDGLPDAPGGDDTSFDTGLLPWFLRMVLVFAVDAKDAPRLDQTRVARIFGAILALSGK